MSGSGASLLLQGVLVGVVVGACALYSAWRLASLRLRLRVLDALGSLPAVAAAPWLTPRLAALKRRTLAQLAGGCAGCAAGGAPTRDAAARPNQTPGALRR